MLDARDVSYKGERAGWVGERLLSMGELEFKSGGLGLEARVCGLVGGRDGR